MSGKLMKYLHQKAVWSRDTGDKDAYAKPVREETQIYCRIEKRTRLIRDQYGKEKVSDTTLYTENAVKAGDLIDGRPVTQVSDMVGRCGLLLGYEVCL